jgi:hypothetical protein
MAKTTEAKMAIREATRMHLNHEDPYFMGKTILRQSYRLKLLEEILVKTETYILSSEGSKEEAELIEAINKVNTISPIIKNSVQRILIN